MGCGSKEKMKEKSKLGTSGNHRAFKDLAAVSKKNLKMCCLILEILRMFTCSVWIIILAVLYFQCHSPICANDSSNVFSQMTPFDLQSLFPTRAIF